MILVVVDWQSKFDTSELAELQNALKHKGVYLSTAFSPNIARKIVNEYPPGTIIIYLSKFARYLEELSEGTWKLLVGEEKVASEAIDFQPSNLSEAKKVIENLISVC